MRVTSKSISADIVGVGDAGSFVAVASSPTVDRDGESLAANCFEPLPKSVPVHLDHVLNAANVVARAVPRYSYGDLVIEAVFSTSPEAQQVRQKVVEGILDSVSVAFRAAEWAWIDSVRTCVKAELLSVDLVSVPSQPAAKIVSVRNYEVVDRGPLRTEMERTLAEARQVMIRYDIAQAKRYLAELAAPQATSGASDMNSSLPAHQSRAFEPSTFKSRLAERLGRGEPERPPKRLVSYGIRKRWLEPAGRTGRGRMIEVETVVDVRSCAVFTRMVPNGTLEPTMTSSGGESAEDLGFVAARGFNSGLFAAGRKGSPSACKGAEIARGVEDDPPSLIQATEGFAKQVLMPNDLCQAFYLTEGDRRRDQLEIRYFVELKTTCPQVPQEPSLLSYGAAVSAT